MIGPGRGRFAWGVPMAAAAAAPGGVNLERADQIVRWIGHGARER